LSDAFTSGKVWALCAIYFTLMIGLYGIAFLAADDCERHLA